MQNIYELKKFYNNYEKVYFYEDEHKMKTELGIEFEFCLKEFKNKDKDMRETYLSYKNYMLKTNNLKEAINLSGLDEEDVKYDLKLNDSLIVYLGGFHNSILNEFLFKLYNYLGNQVKYLHFGDIDAGGFYIYLNLIHKTGIPFQTWKMDISTLKQYEMYTKPLTLNDRNRLLKLKEEYNQPVIDYMLKKNIKLEQEIITFD